MIRSFLTQKAGRQTELTANIGSLSLQVNSVVNAIQRVTKSKKLPLIILHMHRVNGGNAKAPYNQKILESWRKAGALYATPPGSNDDW